MIKITDEEITVIFQETERSLGGLFDDENEALLNDIVSRYFILKKDFIDKRKAPHENNFIEAFKTRYRIEFEIEPFLEFREFVESGDYAESYSDRLRENAGRSQKINLRQLGME